ncbi:hypothetical protein OC846_001510 [Tilletia horrida]|uniref:Phenazine biosynthesis protein n=1 Tax=Tilletia horrida TaxID=155126 RepID=A0AAN6JZT8_9BASI|nr:hypothetical protein OC846_001510 [Tilletia horrida]KAK0568846.1 hypothetical protein OC861_001539 [Tilletia horrida]
MTVPIRRAYAVYDVFTSEALKGNPVAVVYDTAGLENDEEAKQAFARWTNLSETVFIYPPTDSEADYRLEIFTPARRLPFAGHPTIGAANAWLDQGGHKPKRDGFLTQQCDIGLVKLKITSLKHGDEAAHRLFFAAPPFIQEGEIEPELLRRICAGLNLDPEKDVLGARLIDNGPGWHGIHLKDASTVLDKVPPPSKIAWGELGDKLNIGLVGEYEHTTPANPGQARPTFEVRAIVNGEGQFEDPVTGSLNAGIAKWLIAAGKAPAGGYIASQGFHRKRAGFVHVETDQEAQDSKGTNGTIWVGGDAVRVVDGTLTI